MKRERRKRGVTRVYFSSSCSSFLFDLGFEVREVAAMEREKGDEMLGALVKMEAKILG